MICSIALNKKVILFAVVFFFLMINEVYAKNFEVNKIDSIFNNFYGTGFTNKNHKSVEFFDERIGMANPAAVYCHELGYEYKIVDTDQGQKGICIFPDKSECEEWQFLTGKCGQSYSYCARQGYDLIIKTDGKNPFSRNYAVCVYMNREIGSVTDLFSLSEKATKGTFSTGVNLNATEKVSTMSLPSSFDWRNKNGGEWMTPVKNQGSCGSCWAFSAVGTVEAVYNIYANNPNLDLDLSEQQLVSDCCVSCGNCGGGLSDVALKYVRDTGVVDEACFPYIAQNSSCNLCSDWQKRLYRITDYGSIPSDQATIKQYLIERGPLSAYIRMDGDFIGDIYRCDPDTPINHAIVIAGYDDAGGYWIVKNSWGDSWNGDGYFKVGYGECAIENYVYYAVRGDLVVNQTSPACLAGLSYNTTIQSAINAANSGDTIIVCPGTYNENVNINKPLNILSYSGPSVTIVNASNSSENTIYINAVNYVNISGFTITGVSKTVSIIKGGIYLYESNYSSISNNNASNNYAGIILYCSLNNNIINNTANSNNWAGIFTYCWYFTNNTIINNTANSNSIYGIYLSAANNNMVKDNILNSNNYAGMGSSGSINNTIKNNTIISNKPYGILMLDVYNNSITDNTIKLNPTGIFIHNDSYGYGISNYNAIYNNYFNNSVNAVDTGNNFWNTTKTLGTNIIGGPYIGGNFWSDYNGVDTSNPSDGIGDTLVPYSSNGNIANGGDYLPLVSVCGDGIWEYGEWCGRDCYIATGSTDMNHDCVVDTLDAILITKHFGSINYSSGDLNGDGVVDMHDIVIFSQHYGDFITSCTDAGQYFIDKKGSLSISFSNDTSNIINSTNVSVNSTLNAYIIASDVQNLTSLEFGLLSSPNLIFSGFSVSPGLTLSGGIESRIEIIGDGSQLVSGSAVIGWATYNVTGTGNGNISIIKNSHFGELEWSKNPEELYRANFANIFNATITSSVPINITILSPINSGNYSATSIPLTYTVSEPASWCGYSLDGTANKTIPSCTNITLSGLSYTTHNVIVYANDTSGNMGASGKVYFTVTSGGGRGCGRSCLMT